MLKKIGAGFCFCVAASIYAYSLIGTQEEKGYFQTPSTSIGDGGVKGVISGGEDTRDDAGDAAAKNKNKRVRIERPFNSALTLKFNQEKEWILTTTRGNEKIERKYTASYDDVTGKKIEALISNETVAFLCRTENYGYECEDPSDTGTPKKTFRMDLNIN